MGLEFQPNNNIQLISITKTETSLLCSTECNNLPSCRIIDYDLVSKRCRLFEGDSTTGSIISSSSSTSLVGTVQILSNLYSSIHNQPCQVCQQDRYEVCLTNTSTCGCPDHTYWNGLFCALQLFANETCGQSDACRSDMNLTCIADCYGDSPQCIQAVFDNVTLTTPIAFGVTVAGGCNGSSSTNQTTLNAPSDIVVDNNNALYVGDYTNQLFIFNFNNRTGRALRSYSSWPTLLFFDNRTASIYMTIMFSNIAYIWPTNQTIPPSAIVYGNCSMNWLYFPTGIVVDSVGNVYISSFFCNWITKWAPNATSGTLVAGSSTGTAGSDNLSLNKPYGLALDEPNSFIYVADRFNNRVQRFALGSGIGVTVAGGNGAGSAANQLSSPYDIYLSRLDGSLYISDSSNNRIQKWQKNATSGITVAGSSTGIAGHTPYLLNASYGLALDYNENYLYVADSKNNRIQRFSLD